MRNELFQASCFRASLSATACNQVRSDSLRQSPKYATPEPKKDRIHVGPADRSTTETMRSMVQNVSHTLVGMVSDQCQGSADQMATGRG